MSFVPITLVLIIITTTTSLKINSNSVNHQNYSTSCVMEIIKRQFVSDKKLLTILAIPNMTLNALEIQNKIIKEINHALNWPVEVISGNRIDFESSEVCFNCPVKENQKKIIKNIFQPKYIPALCLMVTNNHENFLKAVQNYLKTTNRHLRAFFLVSISELSENYEKLAEDLLNSLWKYKIFNTAVIIPINSTVLNIYGLNAFATAKKCGAAPKLRLLDFCDMGKIQKGRSLFKNKLPRTFLNCSIKVIAVKYPPNVIDENNGYEISILKQFGKILNISFDLEVKKDVTVWGSRLSRNNWTGTLGEAYNTSSIAIGNVMADPYLAEDFTLSIGYFYEHMVWVVPKALPILRWKNLFVIFQYELWIICILFLTLTAVLFKFSASKNELKCFKSLSTNFMLTLSILLGTAVPKKPKTKLVRTFFISLTTYSMYIVVLYQTLLITFLTNPVYENQISTVEEILDSNQKIGGLESYKDFFNLSTDERGVKIYRMFESDNKTNDAAYTWIKLVANNPTYSTVSSSFYIKYLFNELDQVVIANGKPKIFVLNEILFTYPIRMVLPRGFPLAFKFDKLLGYLINGGIIEKWASSYHRKGTKKEGEKIQSDDEVRKGLTFEDLQGAFNILFFGSILGFVSFIFEIVVVKIKSAPNISGRFSGNVKKQF